MIQIGGLLAHGIARPFDDAPALKIGTVAFLAPKATPMRKRMIKS